MSKNYYSVKEVASILKVSTNTVYKYLNDGSIIAKRLGDEGRFKIPVSEVARLQGVAPETTPVSLPENPTIEPVLERPSTAPQLFDWMLALTVIFISVNILTNPIKIPGLAISGISTIYYAFAVINLLAGSILFLLELFGSQQRKIVSFTARLILAISCWAIAWLTIRSGEPWNGSYFIAFGIGSLVSFFLHSKPSEIKIILYAYVLIMITAVGFSAKPEAYIFSDIRYEVSTNPNQFIALITAGASIVFALLLFTYKRSKVLYPILTTSVSGLFLLLTVSFITTQSWLKTIACLLLGSFFLILPISYEIDNFAKFTRKQLTLSFLWVVVVLGLGIAGMKAVQLYANNLVNNTAKQKTESASRIAERVVSDATTNLVRLSNDPVFKNSPISSMSAEILRDRSRNVYFSNSILRRVFFVTPEGVSLADYPPILSVNIPTINNRDYILKVRSLKQPVISSVTVPAITSANLSPTMYIAVPILSETNEYAGAIVGAIDPLALQDRLNMIVESEGSKVSIQDQVGNVLVGEPSSSTDNPSVSHLGFDQNGKLVYKTHSTVPTLNWLITLNQLYEVAFRQAGLLSSAVFFICTIAGIGSLLLNIHFRIHKEAFNG